MNEKPVKIKGKQTKMIYEKHNKMQRGKIGNQNVLLELPGLAR